MSNFKFIINQFPLMDPRVEHEDDSFVGHGDDRRLTPRGWFRHAPAENGFSAILVILMATLIMFILWEITAQSGLLADSNYKFIQQQAALNTGKTTTCNFPIPGDPCDLDSGAGFDKSGL